MIKETSHYGKGNDMWPFQHGLHTTGVLCYSKDSEKTIQLMYKLFSKSYIEAAIKLRSLTLSIFI